MIVDKVQPASVTAYLYYDPRESHAAAVKINFSMSPVKQLFLSHGFQTYVSRPLCLASVLFWYPNTNLLDSRETPRQKYVGGLAELVKFT